MPREAEGRVHYLVKVEVGGKSLRVDSLSYE